MLAAVLHFEVGPGIVDGADWLGLKEVGDPLARRPRVDVLLEEESELLQFFGEFLNRSAVLNDLEGEAVSSLTTTLSQVGLTVDAVLLDRQHGPLPRAYLDRDLAHLLDDRIHHGDHLQLLPTQPVLHVLEDSQMLLQQFPDLVGGLGKLIQQAQVVRLFHADLLKFVQKMVCHLVQLSRKFIGMRLF